MVPDVLETPPREGTNVCKITHFSLSQPFYFFSHACKSWDPPRQLCSSLKPELLCWNTSTTSGAAFISGLGTMYEFLVMSAWSSLKIIHLQHCIASQRRGAGFGREEQELEQKGGSEPMPEPRRWTSRRCQGGATGWR